MNLDKEREAFEAAYSKILHGRGTPPTFAAFMKTADGEYELPIVERAWAAWQARAALDEQKAGPSDEEIAAILGVVLGKDVRPTAVTVDFARALLSKYAEPAPKGEPVAWPRVLGISRDLHPRCLMISLAQEPTDDQMRAIHESLKGSYAAPVNEQDAKDAQRYRWLRSKVEKDLACVIFRAHEHIGCGVVEFLDQTLDAAIAQQGKGESNG